MKFTTLKQTKFLCLSFFLTLLTISVNQKICNAASYVGEDEHIKVIFDSIERNVSSSEYPGFLSGPPKNGYEYIMAQITLVSLKDVNICAGKSVMDGLILHDSGNLIYNIINCQIQGIEFQDIHDITSNARLIEGSIFQSFFEIPKGRELFKFDFIYPYGNTGWGDCINQGQVEIILIPHSSQNVYRNGDQIKVYIPSPFEDYTRYIGLSLPDGTLLIFTDLNAAVIFDGHSLPSWKGLKIMLDLQNQPVIPRGDYIVYSLQVPTGVDPFTLPPEALLATTTFTIDQDCDSADAPCQNDGQSYSASGTYTYNSGTGVLVVNFTNSNFGECGPEIGTEQFTVVSISSATMIWIDDNDQTTWTRNGGTSGNIIGIWEYVDDGNTFELEFYPNGSFVLSGHIVNCDQDVEISDFTIPRANITIDGNRADWDSIEPVFTDAMNDEDPEADFDGTDLYQFYLSRDDSFLYLMITLYDGNPNPNAQYALEMVPNAGKSKGEEGDYLAVAVVRDGNWRSSVHVRDVPSLNTQYPIGYVGIGDHFIEWKVKLSDMHFFNDRYINVYIHDFSPIFYPVSDRKATGIRIHLN